MIVLITQARTGSSRLPGKILKTVNGSSLLDIHLSRIKKTKCVDLIIVATTDKEEDDIVTIVAQKNKVEFFRGSETNVLDRFYQSCKDLNAKYIVRVTSDCPLIDPILIDSVINKTIKDNLDYCSNVLVERFPDGQDVEVFKFNALEKAWKNAVLDHEKEHVTPYIINNSSFKNGELFKSNSFYSDFNYNEVRLTVDEQNDFLVMEKIIQECGVNKSWEFYAKFYLENKSIHKLNKHIIRNEGFKKSLNFNK